MKWLQSRAKDYSSYVRSRLEVGALGLAVDYVQAQRIRAAFQVEMGAALARFDLLATPATPATATRIGDSDKPINKTVGPAVFAMPRLTSVISLTGLPAITVPCGFTKSGLPIGLQLVARPFEEATLIRAAHAYERSVDWFRRRPPLGVGHGNS